MKLRAQAVARMIGDIVAHAVRSGNWWFPIALILLAVALVLGFTAQVVVPTAVYTLF